jgi:hypothetical protein
MRSLSISLLASLVIGQLCLAQQSEAKAGESNPPGPRFYRLDFTVKELEMDKVVNTRTYSTTLSNDSRHKASIRVGSRVPVSTSPRQAEGAQALVSTQHTFYDVGVNIDANEGRDLGNGQYTLNVETDISSVVTGKDATGDLPPVVRRTTWRSPVVVPLRKATTVFSSDDPTGNRKMQLELTVSPM